MRRWWSLLLCALLSGCALPPAAVDTAGFVAQDELEVTGLVREGLGFMRRARYVDAELAFRQAQYLAPDADTVKENLALALVGTEQFAEADTLLRALALKYPRGTRHTINLAQSYYRQGRTQEAAQRFSAALEGAYSRREFAAAASVARSMSFLEMERGRAQEALCYSAEAYALKSDSTEAISHARVLLEQGLYPQAISVLTAVSASSPEVQRETNRLLALAAYGKEDYQAAATYARQVQSAVSGVEQQRSELGLLIELAQKRIEPAARESNEERNAAEGQAQVVLDPKRSRYWPPNLLRDLAAQPS